MRRFLLSAVLGLGLLGTVTVADAKASWLSELLNNSQVQVNVGTPYPQPVYAPVPPVYAPVPVYRPAYVPAPVFAPAVPVAPVYAPVRPYRPVVVPAPVHAHGVPAYPAPAYRPVPVAPPHHGSHEHQKQPTSVYRPDWRW